MLAAGARLPMRGLALRMQHRTASSIACKLQSNKAVSYARTGCLAATTRPAIRQMSTHSTYTAPKGVSGLTTRQIVLGVGAAAGVVGLGMLGGKYTAKVA